MAEMRIREMKSSDVEAVMEIDKKSFASPWTEEIFNYEIKENKFAHYFIVETDNTIIGYVGLWVVYEDAQITNIAILKKYRGFKIGEHLFGYALQHAQNLGAERLSLEVRISNEIAQNMYQKFGLAPGGIRKKYYTDDNEDALVMWVNLT